MTRFVYFAYGSNMLTERLTARCPSAEVIGPGQARGYAVSYCLASPDDSAKAGLQRVEGAVTWGVLFSLAQRDQSILDGFEGAPVLYRQAEIDVIPADGGETISAITYMPQPAHIIDDGRPFAWYRALCVGGARQHDLPADSIAKLEETDLLPMPEPEAPAWEGRAHALAALKAAGLSMPKEGL